MYKFVVFTLFAALVSGASFQAPTLHKDSARVDPGKTLLLIRRIKNATEAGHVVS